MVTLYVSSLLLLVHNLIDKMSEIYERRLKKEFSFLQRLQNHPNTRGIIDIYYKERINGHGYKSVTETPNCTLYPNHFKIKYTFPVMYVGRGQVKNNWSHAFLLTTPETILMDPNRTIGDEFEIEGGAFSKGNVPFNSHISPNWVCIGALWQAANQGFGIWYFLVSLGALLNQEKTEMDPNDEIHLNDDAFNYWLEDRDMQPNNIIRWPYNLDQSFVISGSSSQERASTVNTEKKSMKITLRSQVPNEQNNEMPKRSMTLKQRNENEQA